MVFSPRLLCTALALVLCGAGAGAADGPTSERLAELRLEWHRQEARKEVAGWEVDLLAPPRPPGPSVGQFQDPSALLAELRPVLAADYGQLRTDALKLAEVARARADTARRDWEGVYKEKVTFRRYADEQGAAHGFDLDTGQRRGFQFGPLDALLLAWAGVAFAVARARGRRVRRVALRRAQRATAIALLLCAFSGCGGGDVSGTRNWTATEEAELIAATAVATEQAAAATAEADRKWRAVVESRSKLVAVPGVAGPSAEAVVRDGEAQVRERLQAAARDARLAARLAKEAEADRAQLTANREKLDHARSGARWQSVGFAAARCAAAAVLFALAIAPYRRAVRREAAALAADVRKCPRCFAEKLVVEKVAAPDSRGSAGRKAKALPQAEARETGYVECRTCGFRFLRSYQEVRRLCFPAVGVRNSGKTHLLATAYDKVRKQVAPTAATAVPAPSLADERFDLYIDLILNLKRDAGNTLHDVNTPPDPVMVHVRDADPVGANTALVNLFDYSGELVNQRIDVDRLKRQAVCMDGFMLFLDPTQLDGRKGGVTLDRQLAALNAFMADMREARGVAPGDVIPVPVAVVIPKFDLLPARNPIGPQAVPFIRTLTGELTPAHPKRTTLDVIRRRSELVEEMLELMFRGVDVRALVESYFGRQVMFFPASAVSLFEGELGEEDLSKRTIAPFGVAEPFLWLLHMHGYDVFGDAP